MPACVLRALTVTTGGARIPSRFIGNYPYSPPPVKDVKRPPNYVPNEGTKSINSNKKQTTENQTTTPKNNLGTDLKDAALD